MTEFDVAHSRRHVQRLMKKPRPEPSSADETELERYDKGLEKKSDGATTQQS